MYKANACKAIAKYTQKMESQVFFSQGDTSNEYNLDFITQICSQDLEEFLIQPASWIVDDDCFNDEVFDGQVEAIPNLVFPMGMVENKALGSTGSVEEDDSENHGDSSGTTTNSTRPRRDHAKTLVTERKRRGRMKERLYELRSLVPNITKMDKASVISDAVGYVRDLQDQARKLEEEIAEMESSPRPGHVMASRLEERHHSVCEGTILGVEAYEVGEGRFYGKVECSKRESAATSLYNAIESLECFHLDHSNFSMGADRYVLTLSLNANGFGGEMNASAVKFWMMSALLKEGFQLEVVPVT